ncbi:hypothetical protein ACIG3E_33030 [Streptomyces sp. NPDC053474]|uniref:hypothetical protein n=1 Tax=Streptomyces sp. NPDC053474 TaxID=3365704 RepID=UPI0037D3234D
MGGAFSYVDRSSIADLLGLEDSTLSNTLTALKKKGRIHLEIVDGKEVRARYALGPDPTALTADEEPTT